jgi:hypothetical protein
LDSQQGSGWKSNRWVKPEGMLSSNDTFEGRAHVSPMVIFLWNDVRRELNDSDLILEAYIV